MYMYLILEARGEFVEATESARHVFVLFFQVLRLEPWKVV